MRSVALATSKPGPLVRHDLPRGLLAGKAHLPQLRRGADHDGVVALVVQLPPLLEDRVRVPPGVVGGAASALVVVGGGGGAALPGG